MSNSRENKSLTIVLKANLSHAPRTSFTTICCFYVCDNLRRFAIDMKWNIQRCNRCWCFAWFAFLLNIIKLQLYGLFMDADSANSTRVIVDDDDLLAPARYFKSQNLFLIHLIFFFVDFKLCNTEKRVEIDIKVRDISSSWKHFQKWTHYNAVVFYAWQWQLINVIY